MKRALVALFVVFVLGVPLAALAIAWLALEPHPSVVRKSELTPEQIKRARAVARAHDPRANTGDSVRVLKVSAQDLDAAANYVLAPRGGGAKVELRPGALMFWTSAPVPGNPFGRYLNVEGVLRQTSGLPEIDNLRIGRVTVPGPLADWLLHRALAYWAGGGNTGSTAEVVDSVRLAAAEVEVVYRWREELRERLRAGLLPAAEQERLQPYHERLAQLSADPALPRQASLRTVLVPLMALAAQRSASGDAVAENRAALLVLTFYVNGRNLAHIAPAAREWMRPQPRKLTLHGRHDLAQHFIVSAALAATAGSPLADAIGVSKEVDDARGGSGFSFSDLAADRAGTVFGERATRSAEQAGALQRRVGAGVAESDFMPDIAGLPEGMRDAEFKRRFGGVGELAYQQMSTEIERRVARLALYR